jgi:hypothetical protein
LAEWRGGLMEKYIISSPPFPSSNIPISSLFKEKGKFLKKFNWAELTDS